MTSTSDGPDARTALDRSPLGEERIKHLEFIQAVINRMATNSFFVKGWVLTLAAGLLTMSASRLSWQSAVVGLVPLLCFWSLDGYCLQQERLFRHLYDDVRRVDSAIEPFADSDVTRSCTRPSPVHSSTCWVISAHVSLITGGP
jgi:hypothetical protein